MLTTARVPLTSEAMRTLLRCASPFTRTDGKTGRLVYGAKRTVLALQRRGYVTAYEYVNNGNARAILTQAGIDLRAHLTRK